MKVEREEDHLHNDGRIIQKMKSQRISYNSLREENILVALIISHTMIFTAQTHVRVALEWRMPLDFEIGPSCSAV